MRSSKYFILAVLSIIVVLFGSSVANAQIKEIDIIQDRFYINDVNDNEINSEAVIQEEGIGFDSNTIYPTGEYHCDTLFETYIQKIDFVVWEEMITCYYSVEYNIYDTLLTIVYQRNYSCWMSCFNEDIIVDIVVSPESKTSELIQYLERVNEYGNKLELIGTQELPDNILYHTYHQDIENYCECVSFYNQHKGFEVSKVLKFLIDKYES